MGNTESKPPSQSHLRSSVNDAPPPPRLPSQSSGNSKSKEPLTPGAHRMQGQPTTQRYQVTIPNGVRPGQHFNVMVSGQQMMVQCPEDRRPGENIYVTLPNQQNRTFVVNVPPNVRPGQQFRVNINNQDVLVTCPRGVRPGQRVTFNLPEQQPQTQNKPNFQMFEVIVPPGVQPGKPFALFANNQKVM